MGVFISRNTSLISLNLECDLHNDKRLTLEQMTEELKKYPNRLEERKNVIVSASFKQQKETCVPQCTPLLAACIHGNWQLVRYLLSIGAKVNAAEEVHYPWM